MMKRLTTVCLSLILAFGLNCLFSTSLPAADPKVVYSCVTSVVDLASEPGFGRSEKTAVFYQTAGRSTADTNGDEVYLQADNEALVSVYPILRTVQKPYRLHMAVYTRDRTERVEIEGNGVSVLRINDHLQLNTSCAETAEK